MIDDRTTDGPIEIAAVPARTDSPHSLARRALLAARVLQVRLRFVIVLVVAFLVMGFWGNLRNYWDTWTHRFAGAQHGAHSVSDDTEYFCPMDPGVVSDWPAICPVCNMDLVRRKKGEAVILPEGLVARMQFSPYRIQLAGIRTSVIGRQDLTREIVIAGRLVAAGAISHSERPDSTSPQNAGTAEKLVLECEAFAGDLALLKPGRRASISVEAWPGFPPLAGVVAATEDAPGGASVRAPLTVRIRLEDPPAGLQAGMFCTARVQVPLAEIAPFGSSLAAPDASGATGFLAVPETAVVDTGSRQLVFVETMPGMFDGVEVTLGPRCGDLFPVLKGLEPGQKVATVGAFLIDAEARLSRNVAASYFGAARTAEPGADKNSAAAPVEAAAKPVETPKRPSKKSKLSAADQTLVQKQKTCPVTDLPLDSMGGPVAYDIGGQRVFLCCKGCESKLKQDPQKYLAKLKSK